jgi:hypothetical protein
MKSLLTVGAVALSVFLLAEPAHAVDISNQDTEDRTVTVTEGGESNAVEIAAGETVESVCEKCTISNEGGDKLELSGEQKAVIKDGKLMSAE